MPGKKSWKSARLNAKLPKELKDVHDRLHSHQLPDLAHVPPRLHSGVKALVHGIGSQAGTRGQHGLGALPMVGNKAKELQMRICVSLKRSIRTQSSTVRRALGFLSFFCSFALFC